MFRRIIDFVTLFYFKSKEMLKNSLTHIILNRVLLNEESPNIDWYSLFIQTRIFKKLFFTQFKSLFKTTTQL